MIVASLSAYIPVNLFDPILADHGISIQATIDELIEACNKRKVHFDENPASKALISRINNDDVPDPSIFEMTGLHFVPNRQFLRIDTTLKMEDRVVIIDGPKLNKKQLEELKIAHLVYSFEKSIYDLTLICNIAHPGSFDIFPGAIYQNNVCVKQTSRMCNELELTFDTAKKMKWPPIIDLKVERVMEWLYKRSYHSQCFSETPIDRALNAFGYLFEDDPSKFGPLHIFWAMIGIEALYCKGTTGIMGQVLNKSQLFLGKQSIHKKVFSRMYDYRSRFIHGDINFPNKYLEYETKEHDRFHRKSGEAEDLAIAILVASIQELIRRNWHELTFTYVVNNPDATRKKRGQTYTFYKSTMTIENKTKM